MDRGNRGRRGRPSGTARASASDRDRQSAADVFSFGDESRSYGITNTTPSQRGRAHGSSLIAAADMNTSSRATPKSDRPAKSSTSMHHAFTFSTPVEGRGPALRKRARTFDFGLDGAADDESEVKGGHSLRKRIRVDYAQMHDDEALFGASQQDLSARTPSAPGPRGRKRRADDDADDFAATSSAPKKRGRYEKRTESPASRRKQRARKSPTPRTSSYAEQPSDTELKDTIEVGVTFSEHDSEGLPSFNQLSDTASVTSRDTEEEEDLAAPPPPVPNLFSEHTPQIVSSPESEEPAVEELVEQQIQNDISKDAEFIPAVETKDKVSSQLEVTETSPKSQNPQRVELNHEDNSVSAPTLPSEDLVTKERPSKDLAAPEIIDEKNQHNVSETAAPVPAVASKEIVEISQPVNIPATLPAETQPVVEEEHPAAPEPESVVIQTTIASETTQDHALEAAKNKHAAYNQSETEEHRDLNKPDLPLETAAKDKGENQESIEKEPSVLSSMTKELNQTVELITGDSDVPASAGPGASPAATERVKVTGPAARNPASGDNIVAGRQNHEQSYYSTKDSGDILEKSLEKVEEVRNIAQFPDGKDYSYLTPYLDEVVLLPELAEISAAPTPAMTASQSVDDQVLYDEKLADENGVEEDNSGEGSQERQEIAASEEANGSQMEPTAASPAEEDVTPVLPTSTPASAAASQRNTPVPTPNQAVAESRPLKLRKQYPHPKIRDPSEFMDIIANYKEMSTSELYNALSAINACMTTWQNDYNELRKITDDEDNAVRRRAQDAAYEAKVIKEMAKPSSENITLERDFVVRGIRVKEATYQNEKHYFKQQDRLMSEVYHFEYDPRESMMGKQDPLLQREGLQNTRLRNRPKQTQKAAEAADDPAAVTVTGKRTRKPRILDDGSKDPSRAATPTDPTKKPIQRRRRGRQPKEATPAENDTFANTNGVTNGGVLAQQMFAPEKKGRGRRGGKAAQQPAATTAEDVTQRRFGEYRDEEPENLAFLQKEPQQQEQPKTRKRGRGGRKANEATKREEDFAEPQPPAKRQRTRPAVEIPSMSFYNEPSPADTIATPTEEERPTTSSSNGTTQTVESNYSFRERKRKNYNDLLAFGGYEMESEPKPKRTRRAKGEQTPVPLPPIPTPMSSGSSAPLAARSSAALPRPASPGAGRQRVRLHNGTHAPNPGAAALAALAPAPLAIALLPTSSRGSSAAPSKGPSRRATPAPSATSSSVPPAGDDEPTKDYHAMTKSEKMSNSMKARWANGSMARAVEKRKETLARKKQAQQELQQQQQQQLLLQGGAAGAAGTGEAPGHTPAPILPAVPIAAAPAGLTHPPGQRRG
ncbi:hypothetical protein NKR23_g9732 [Pleurostoma richardsiae]|uniref:Uncharacterized protein n=1 Tax=Pleurostoma richardsiae TaxID=41990 RepID=A0AA38VJ74_9PEZI|nr:hypothetical protein NKR23_g9732 [Pleurostoma richardsiae]